MKLITTLALLALATPALAITPDQIKACEKAWRDQVKTENAAAPAGFKPARARGARQDAIAACLSK